MADLVGIMIEPAADMKRSTELVVGFAEALGKLVPHFEQSEIGWREGKQYDNYDRIADILFRELVLHPLTYEFLGEERSYQYDMPPYEAAWGGLRVVGRLTDDDLGPFVRLVSVNRVMDGVVYSKAGIDKSASLNDVLFKLWLR